MVIGASVGVEERRLGHAEASLRLRHAALAGTDRGAVVATHVWRLRVEAGRCSRVLVHRMVVVQRRVVTRACATPVEVVEVPLHEHRLLSVHRC